MTTSVADYNERRPAFQGFVREWRQCRDCKAVYAHDYQPYSIGNPMRWTPCGHSVGYRDLNCDTITEAQADKYFAARARVEARGAPAVPTFRRRR